MDQVVTENECPNDHGLDNIILCWSPGGPCEWPNDPACELCGRCFYCTDRQPFERWLLLLILSLPTTFAIGMWLMVTG